MNTRLVSSLAIATMLLGAGCAPSTSQTPPAAVSMQDALLAQDWVMIAERSGTTMTDVASQGWTLSFQGGRISGRICNSMSGPYTLEGNRMTFGGVAMTKMFCTGQPGEIEADFSASLSDGFTVTIENDQLTLTDTDDDLAFVFAKKQ